MISLSFLLWSITETDINFNFIKFSQYILLKCINIYVTSPPDKVHHAVSTLIENPNAVTSLQVKQTRNWPCPDGAGSVSSLPSFSVQQVRKACLRSSWFLTFVTQASFSCHLSSQRPGGPRNCLYVRVQRCEKLLGHIFRALSVTWDQKAKARLISSKCRWSPLIKIGIVQIHFLQNGHTHVLAWCLYAHSCLSCLCLDCWVALPGACPFVETILSLISCQRKKVRLFALSVKVREENLLDRTMNLLNSCR